MPGTPLIIRGGLVVSPCEVEQVLLGHPAVSAVVVAGVPDRLLGELVGAAVTLSAPLGSAAATLSAYCRGFMAGYMVPERWLFTPALPGRPDGEARRATVAAQLAVLPRPTVPWLPVVDPVDRFRPRSAAEDLRIPRQVRRS